MRSSGGGWLLKASCACPFAGDSVYRCCLRGGWGSVVRMTHFVPFYYSLPLYPHPQKVGGPYIQRKKTDTTKKFGGGLFGLAPSQRLRSLSFRRSVPSLRKDKDRIRLRPSIDVRNHPQIFSSCPAA